MRAPKHDWHTLDARRAVWVRQATNRLRRNRWEVRGPTGLTVKMSDDEFDRYRSGEWSPWGLQ